MEAVGCGVELLVREVAAHVVLRGHLRVGSHRGGSELPEIRGLPASGLPVVDGYGREERDQCDRADERDGEEQE